MKAHLLSTSTLALHLGVAPATVRAWASSGQIPVYRVTERTLRFDLEAVLEKLRACAPHDHRQGDAPSNHAGPRATGGRP